MKKILHVTSSIFGDGGQSSQLAEKFVNNWLAANPGASVIRRDLDAEPLPHISAEIFTAFTTPPEDRDEQQRKHADLSDQLINELKESDVIALGLPMYNFGIPSTLKAWIDQIARAGQTFKYTENGSVGLLEGKKAFIFAARGGMYKNTDKDSQTAFIQTFLTFLGITDIEIVYAEGLAMGDEKKQSALISAANEVDLLAVA
ncbi:MAG: FMN-dependent NADH-azoreductase [Sneathiella sp.]|nr:MAG: FMN-dependent NADH-azoreductase [Sneathiella sp.]